jgi:hypothetical protein
MKGFVSVSCEGAKMGSPHCLTSHYSGFCSGSGRSNADANTDGRWLSKYKVKQCPHSLPIGPDAKQATRLKTRCAVTTGEAHR